MSLIGLDVGTSSLKIAAYQEDGRLLASTQLALTLHTPRPGWSEVAPSEVWRATQIGLKQIAGESALRRDPPRALAIAASGDEVFPVDSRGEALAACIMSGDTRGQAVEARTVQHATPQAWYAGCGHVPERMDPVNRILWWREHAPEMMPRVERFLGWHEYLTLHLCGEAITDPSLAAKWAIYDLQTQDWSTAWMHKLGIDAGWLPRIAAWGRPIGVLDSALQRALGFSQSVSLGVGAFDASCAALGAGVSQVGVVGLACGSWEVVTVPTDNRTISQQIRAAEFPLVPHPGAAGFALLAQSPNGASVMQWLSELVGHDLSALLAAVNATSGGPAPVLAIPHLSGSINPQHGGRNSRAAFLGMTLATTPAVLLQALLESVAYDLALVLRQFSASGFAHHVLRATGGGARADWWMQLKADLTGLPVEVVQCREPGTFGAAILAGVAAGIYPSPGQAAEAMVHIGQRFAPNAHRCRLHREQLAAYRDVVAALMPTNRRLSHAAL